MNLIYNVCVNGFVLVLVRYIEMDNDMIILFEVESKAFLQIEL